MYMIFMLFLLVGLYVCVFANTLHFSFKKLTTTKIIKIITTFKKPHTLRKIIYHFHMHKYGMPPGWTCFKIKFLVYEWRKKKKENSEILKFLFIHVWFSRLQCSMFCCTRIFTTYSYVVYIYTKSSKYIVNFPCGIYFTVL